MRRIAFIFFAAACVGVACSRTSDGVGTPPAPAIAEIGVTGTTGLATDVGTYRISFKPAPSPIPFNELFALDVTVTRADGAAVGDIQLGADARMPAHGHGMSVQPTVERVGAGRFRVDGMELSMIGQWVLRFTVTGAGGAEAAVGRLTLRP